MNVFRIAAVAAAVVAGGLGCKDAEREVASGADLTVRQLVAALNGRSREALGALVVITSTTGGPPRALRARELERVMVPDPPFEVVGAGTPGTVVLVDGVKTRRVVRLVSVGGAVKVLATNEALTAYLERETGTPMAAPEESFVRIVSIMQRADP